MSTPVAMHVSDGVLDAPVAALFALVAVLGVVVAATRARRDLDDRAAPMLGLVAAFVFATQMLNFPVLPGVSGHVLGGALAAILVGPWAGALCLTIVVVVQALVFADGGLTALGANVTNMALIGTAAGYLVALTLRSVAGRGRFGLLVVAFLAGLAGTVATASGFLLEFGMGGDPTVPTETVTTMVLVTHVLIGVGEGAVTALTVTAVAAVRPDLVHLLRATGQPASSAPGDAHGVPEQGGTEPRVTNRRRHRLFYAGFAVLALVLAGLVSYLADSSPDGLEAASLEGCQVVPAEAGNELVGNCIARSAQAPQAAFLLADYSVHGDTRLLGVAGVLGVLAVLALGYGVHVWLRRRSRRS